MGIVKTFGDLLHHPGDAHVCRWCAIAGCIGGKNDGCSSGHCCGIACSEKGRPFVPCCTAFGMSLVLGGSLCPCCCVVAISCPTTASFGKLLHLPLLLLMCSLSCTQSYFFFVVVLAIACVASCLSLSPLSFITLHTTRKL